jgi:hypothetical protein
MKIIFLDIDGVLQPERSAIRFTNFDVKDILIQTPFGEKRPELIEEITSQQNFEKTSALEYLRNCLAKNDIGYKFLNAYDIAAVCCDWHKESVKLLKQLCDKTGAQIVVSSNWRHSNGLNQLKLLFKIHELDAFVIDTTTLVFGDHPSQIKEYITTHSNIKQFVIFDDSFCYDFERIFPN